jgi:hypothetical protein
MIVEYTKELIEMQASLPDAARPGCRVVILELDSYDKAWNPERNDTLLRGPARLTYVFWEDDGGVDVVARPIETVQTVLV